MLSSSEICEIIRECGAKGVTSFKMTKDTLEVRYGEPKTVVTQSFVVPESTPQTTLEPQGPTELEYREADPKKIDAEDELQELSIVDPLEYEERIARGELVDGPSSEE